MDDQITSQRIAGSAAIGAGLAWVLWALINGLTHGRLESGLPPIGLRIAKLGQLLMVAWNLLLIPGALVLWNRLRSRASSSALLATVCGITSLLFWAYGGATRGITPMLEVTYLLLAGVWLVGIGWLLRPTQRVFGMFTVILGGFVLLDATLSFLEPMPFYIYALAAPKLPLSIIWDFWLGIVLLSRGSAAAEPEPAGGI
jgi:hypothetical protein